MIWPHMWRLPGLARWLLKLRATRQDYVDHCYHFTGVCRRREIRRCRYCGAGASCSGHLGRYVDRLQQRSPCRDAEALSDHRDFRSPSWRIAYRRRVGFRDATPCAAPSPTGAPHQRARAVGRTRLVINDDGRNSGFSLQVVSSESSRRVRDAPVGGAVVIGASGYRAGGPGKLAAIFCFSET